MTALLLERTLPFLKRQSNNSVLLIELEDIIYLVTFCFHLQGKCLIYAIAVVACYVFSNNRVCMLKREFYKMWPQKFHLVKTCCCKSAGMHCRDINY